MSSVVSSLMNMPDPEKQLGFPPAVDSKELKRREELRISLILASHGVSLAEIPSDESLLDTSFITKDLIQNYREKVRLLSGMLCPPATRILDFIQSHFSEYPELLKDIKLPSDALVLPTHGLARSLSFPIDSNKFEGDIIKSYRLANQGVLHNPVNDKRTTVGSFHIAEGGLPITADKFRVPKDVFARMLGIALKPPKKLNVIPYTSGTSTETSMMVSLLLRPLVCPEIPGVSPKKSMEVYCLAPGTLVSCLDFLETVFGNAGDPFLPENDAALDVETWVGCTGFLLLAPHLTKTKKKDLGLPNWEKATPLQREQGMCWKDENECYNDGRAFKCTSRTSAGVVLTILGDNYFGYCKKEVKTQITYSANIMGMSEEEHAGGTLAFPRYYDGMTIDSAKEAKRWRAMSGYTFEKSMKLIEGSVELRAGGYAVDKTYGEKITYVPENANFSLLTNSVTWKCKEGKDFSINLSPEIIYVLPSGFKIHVEHHPAAHEWRLICTDGRGTFLHKPCTVSGGGKSELSKSIAGGMLYGPLFINDPLKDFDLVDEILFHDCSNRFLNKSSNDLYTETEDESILSPLLSLGGVINILTPSRYYTEEYNTWLKKFPQHILQIVFSVKRFYKEEWGKNWRNHFSMDLINGAPGHELKFDNRKIISGFLRVGYTSEGQMWRTYKTRIDFVPSAKVQLEDDISCAVTVPRKWLPKSSLPTYEVDLSPKLKKQVEIPLLLSPQAEPNSLKLVTNCEFRLFQRPDDCIYRGEDTQTEIDLSVPGNFIANFEPLTSTDIKKIVQDVCNFELFSKPMQNFLKQSVSIAQDSYVVCSSNTRLVGGKPTKNPRYLQIRPDAVDHMETYLASVGTRLSSKIPKELPVIYTVDLLFLGRRISPPGPGLPNLCIYNPMHYQELPELFMDIICSVSGTSPSTTGAGSEGALTKGPFNSLPFTADLNNFLLTCALTGLGGWSTPTGNIGPKTHFAHDISLLTPEVWCRMKAYERDPLYLIQREYLEKVKDFEYKGRTVYASRLGYRITEKFSNFFGHVFDFPKVFEDFVLRPELQDLDGFVDGVDSLITVQKVIAQKYFEDGTVELASPPIKALLHIMYHGNYEGKGINDPEIRSMFLRDNILNSDWYNERILEQQSRDIDLWTRHVKTLTSYISSPQNEEPTKRLNLKKRLENAKNQLSKVSNDEYRHELVGSICADLLPRVEKKKGK